MIFQILFIRNFIIVKDRGDVYMKKFNNKYIYIVLSLIFMNINTYFQYNKRA